MKAGIDPKVDFAFKWLFGREQNLSMLIDLLNAIIMPSSEKRIVGIEILNPFNPQDSSNDKLSIFDIKARDFQGRQFDIEMQIVNTRDFSTPVNSTRPCVNRFLFV